MPAETHSHREDVDVEMVVDLLVNELELDDDDPASIGLARLGIDDELSLMHLWEPVAEEFGERTLGELELPEQLPLTLGDLARLFHGALGGGAAAGSSS